MTLDSESARLFSDAHNVASNLGALLLAERKRRGVPVHVVSDQSGVSRAVIWRIEHGNDAKVSTLLMLLAWMLRDEKDDQNDTSAAHTDDDRVRSQ